MANGKNPFRIHTLIAGRPVGQDRVAKAIKPKDTSGGAYKPEAQASKSVLSNTLARASDSYFSPFYLKVALSR